MKLFSRVAATFWHPENPGEHRDLKPLAFDHNAPEWIGKDPLFALLIKDGTLDVIKDTKTQKAIEKDPAKKGGKKAKEKDNEQ